MLPQQHLLKNIISVTELNRYVYEYSKKYNIFYGLIFLFAKSSITFFKNAMNQFMKKYLRKKLAEN